MSKPVQVVLVLTNIGWVTSRKPRNKKHAPSPKPGSHHNPNFSFFLDNEKEEKKGKVNNEQRERKAKIDKNTKTSI